MSVTYREISAAEREAQRMEMLRQTGKRLAVAVEFYHGRWLASVESMPGVMAYGDDLAQAKKFVRLLALWAAIEGIEEELRRADAVVGMLLDTADRYEMNGHGVTALALIAVADVAIGASGTGPISDYARTAAEWCKPRGWVEPSEVPAPQNVEGGHPATSRVTGKT